jgi:hypothetical protein
MGVLTDRPVKIKTRASVYGGLCGWFGKNVQLVHCSWTLTVIVARPSRVLV